MATSQTLAKNTTFLYIRMFVVLGISLFTTRLILINLGIEDYGIYNIVGSIVSLFTFLQTAVSSANYRYLAFAIGKEDEELLAKTFKSTAILSILISLFVLVIAETVGLYYINNYLNVPSERFVAAYNTFQISVFTCIITTLYMPFYSNVISHERMDFFAYLSIFEAISKILIAVLIAYSPFDKLVFYSSMLGLTQLFSLLFYIKFCVKEFPEIKQAFKIKMDIVLLKKMAWFSGWTLFVAVADLCAVQGVNIIINLFFTPIINAARGIAVQIQGAVDQFRGNLQTAFNPQITKRYASHQKEGMFTLMGCSARYSSYILLLISLPIIFATDEILAFWLKDVPEYTTVFVRITLIASIIDGVSNPFVTAVGATGNIRKFQGVVGLIKFLTLPACYIGVLLYTNPIVAFAIYLFFTLITVAFRIGICSKQIKMKFDYILMYIFYPIFKVSIISVFICYLIDYLIPVNGVLSLIIFIALSLCFIFIMLFYVGLENWERSYIFKYIRKKINK